MHVQTLIGVRYLEALASGAWIQMVVGATIVALLVLLRDRIAQNKWRWIGAGLGLIALTAGLWRVWEQKSVFDDAYITFRYIWNLMEGYGPVFNPGERVEGYSNPLWLLMVTITHVVTRQEIPLAALFLNLGTYLALLVATTWVWRTSTREATLAITPLLLAVQASITAFATTGMETLFGALLVMLAFGYVRDARAGPLGLILSLSIIHRLDHGVFWAGGLLVIAVEAWQRRSARPLLDYLAPLVLVLAHVVFKLAFYGEILPNTYYAKAVDGWALERGANYALTFLGGSSVWLVLPLFIAWVAIGPSHQWRMRLFAGVTVPVWTTYVFKVGGDFMYARFWIPVFPMLLLSSELFVWSRKRRVPRVLAGAALGATLWGVFMFHTERGLAGHGIENRVYPLVGFFPVEIRHPSHTQGKYFRQIFTDRGIDVYLGACCVGNLAYYSRQRMLDFHGLNDREFARKRKGSGRGMAGHEKIARPNEIRARGIHIGRWHQRDPEIFRRHTWVRFVDPPWGVPQEFFSVVNWDAELMARIRKEVPEVRIQSPRRWIRRYRKNTMPKRSREQVAKDLQFLEAFYFDSNNDPANYRPIRAYVDGEDP